MAEPRFESIQGVVPVTLNGTVKTGDFLAHNGTNWVASNATDDTLKALLVALNSGVSGDVINAAPILVLVDDDAPWTANAPIYASAATAGASTSTRPTTVTNRVQIVGWAVSTTRAFIDLQPSVRLASSVVETARGIEIGNSQAFGTTQGTNEAVFQSGTAPAGTLTTGCAIFTDGTSMRKIIAANTVSNIET